VVYHFDRAPRSNLATVKIESIGCVGVPCAGPFFSRTTAIIRMHKMGDLAVVV